MAQLPAETAWRRLHPLSPVVRFGRLLLGLIVLFIPSIESNGTSRHHGTGFTISIALPLLVAALSAMAAVISWAVTRWRIHGTDLQIESGWIRRQSIRIPLARVQAVDVVAPLAARIFGLAEVRVVSAGRGGQHGRLAYLPAEDAAATRARLLALAHGLAPDTPEPPAMPLARVDNGQLVIALCMRAAVLIPVCVIAGMVGLAIALPRAAPGLLSGALPVIVAFGANVARLFNEEFDFAISEAGDGFRLDRGLLQKRHETIPRGRVQAVRLVRPLLWRPFGWLRLEVDVARQRGSDQSRDGSQQVGRTLLPVGGRDQALTLLSRVMPGAGVEAPPAAHPPRRAAWKAPLSYHFLASWFGSRYVYARTGRVQESLVIVPLEKVQSVRLTSGPLQRALRLATVHVDTAGQRWTAACRCRDEAEAGGMLWEVSGGARTARHAAPRLRPATA